jgi:hypothetical protein
VLVLAPLKRGQNFSLHIFLPSFNRSKFDVSGNDPGAAFTPAVFLKRHRAIESSRTNHHLALVNAGGAPHVKH